jgi:hypothetical protein
LRWRGAECDAPAVPRAKTPLQLALAALRERGLSLADDPTSELQRKLLAHRDVICTRLCARKRTLVHRSLWPDVLAMALSGGDWQTKWLPPTEARLLALIDEEGSVRVDEALAERVGAILRSLGKTLETRLLVLGADVATESGSSVRTLTSWWSWAAERGVAPNPDEDEARARLETAARALVPKPLLPWWDQPLRLHRPF